MLSVDLSNLNILEIDQNTLQKGKNAKDELIDSTPAFIEVLQSWPDYSELEDYAENFRDIVVIGVGGSDLGFRAIHRALNHQYYNLLDRKHRVFFGGDTTDPRALKELLEVIDISKALIIVISKSGETIEQSISFLILKAELESKKLNPSEHIIFITGESGTFRELAIRDGYKCLDIPSDLGGRFSVLSNVGLFPSTIMGIDYGEMLRGARELWEEVKSTDFDFGLEYTLKTFSIAKSKSVSVLMPYSYSLYEFAKWYIQLISESLGKDGKGLTPIAALGPVDQHSQLQLFLDGPKDKFVTFVGVKNQREHVNIPLDMNIERLKFLGNKPAGNILKLQLEATRASLNDCEVENCLVQIDQLDAYHLGQLFFFFEYVTFIYARLFEVDPFDQPSVEFGKKLVLQKL